MHPLVLLVFLVVGGVVATPTGSLDTLEPESGSDSLLGEADVDTEPTPSSSSSLLGPINATNTTQTGSIQDNITTADNVTTSSGNISASSSSPTVEKNTDLEAEAGGDVCVRKVTEPIKPVTCKQLREMKFCSVLNFTYAYLAETPEDQDRYAASRYEAAFNVDPTDEHTSECREAYQRFLCAKLFFKCDPTLDVPSVKPCRTICTAMREACAYASFVKEIDCGTEDWRDGDCNHIALPGKTFEDRVVEGHISRSGQVVLGMVRRNEWADFYVDMEKVSAIVVEVKPAETCGHSDPLDVYISHSIRPSTTFSDYEIRKPHNGIYADTVEPDVTQTGKYYVSVRGDAALSSMCRYKLKVFWGPDVCAKPDSLAFCDMLNGRVPIVFRNVLSRDNASQALFEQYTDDRTSFQCRQAMKNWICAKMFRGCNGDGLPLKQCRSQCIDYATSCGFNANEYSCSGDLSKPYCMDNDTYSISQPCFELGVRSEEYCKNNCSNHGTCDILTGRCLCDSNYVGVDCSMTVEALEEIQEEKKDGHKVEHTVIIVVSCCFAGVLIILFGKIWYDRRKRQQTQQPLPERQRLLAPQGAPPGPPGPAGPIGPPKPLGPPGSSFGTQPRSPIYAQGERPTKPRPVRGPPPGY